MISVLYRFTSQTSSAALGVTKGAISNWVYYLFSASKLLKNPKIT